MDYQQKERKALTGQWSGGKKKVKKLDTYFLKGGIWYNTRTGKPEKPKKAGGKKS